MQCAGPKLRASRPRSDLWHYLLAENHWRGLGYPPPKAMMKTFTIALSAIALFSIGVATPPKPQILFDDFRDRKSVV